MDKEVTNTITLRIILKNSNFSGSDNLLQIGLTRILDHFNVSYIFVIFNKSAM